MSIATFIPLLLVSLIGIAWFAILSTPDTHTEVIEAPETRGERMQGVILKFSAACLLVAPLLVILWKAALS